MIGLILAASTGRRLRRYTDTLSIAPVLLDNTMSVIEQTHTNFSAASLNQKLLADVEMKVQLNDRKKFVQVLTFTPQPWPDHFRILKYKNLDQVELLRVASNFVALI